MKKLLLVASVLAFCTANDLLGQNLVPNPSFEEYTQCPNNGGQLEYALHWINPLIPSTPDYLNACGTPAWSTPSNAYGYESAHSGVAYTVIVLARYNPNSPQGNNAREYLEVELLDSLKEGFNYCFEFYVSACDSTHFVTNNIGVYFSSKEIRDTTCQLCKLNYTPQFENDSVNDLTSKIGWSKVSGIYAANGGEKFIIIGNFRDTSTTVAYNVGGGDPFIYGDVAAAYIDDISLYQCDTVTGIVLSKERPTHRVFPNPFHEQFNIISSNKEIKHIEIHDTLNKVVYRQRNYGEQQNISVDMSAYADGVYLLTITDFQSKVGYKIIKN